MIELTIKLYTFDELSEKAKSRAIDEHRNFLLSIMRPEDFISGDPEYDTSLELQKIYNAECEYYLFNDDPIIESIECNEYLFYADGEMCWSCHYTGGPKCGKTEIKIHGELFTLEATT